MTIDAFNVVAIKFGFVIFPAGKTIIEELMVVVVFVGLGHLFFVDNHIKTELIRKRLSPLLNSMIDYFKYILVLAISLFVFFENFPTAIEFLLNWVTSPADIPIPMGPFYFILAISFFNLFANSFFLLFKKIWQFWEAR